MTRRADLPPTDPVALLTAALSDRYRLERELGQGGMATVYLAHDLKHDRRVAVKVMRPEISAGLTADRFLLEIRTTANLQHPHIVPVFDSGQAGGQLFFVMPLIEGESLRARLDREGPLPVDEAVRLVREVAGALEYAHGQGILHRDLKPENILLSRGHALLVDFGIARATLDQARDRLTQVGTSIGTPAYMSPEQATGHQELGPASDVYGLGAILFELLTGDLPFTGATFEAILVKRFTQDAPRVRTRRADIPPACDAAVAKALARDPADRFARVREFAAALTVVSQAAPAAAGKSIAVLPFANLSPDAENGYFADGLTEEVITTLSKVGTLRVISRTTMMRYRGRTDALRDLARELGVSHVLEGSVRKAGNRLRIAASLIAVESDASLWADRFDGLLADVFDMQDRVASAVVGALAVNLSGEEAARLAERPIADPRAYDLYLRAREGLNAFNSTGLQQAFQYLEEARRVDPDNIFLIRGLGRACWSGINAGISADRTLLDRAREHAERIRALAPASPFIAELQGLVAVSEGRFAEAIALLGQAYEAMPGDGDIAFWYGAVLALGGKTAAGIAVVEELRRREPTHPLATPLLGMANQYLGRFDQALRHLDRDILPGAPETAWHTAHGCVLLAAGEPARARTVFARTRDLPPDIFTHISRFLECAISGRAADMRTLVTAEVEASAGHDWHYAEMLAEGYALVGDIDQAARWLKQSVSAGLGCHEAITMHNAVWRPWLDHPTLVPVLELLREQWGRYATLPLPPRVRQLSGENHTAPAATLRGRQGIEHPQVQ